MAQTQPVVIVQGEQQEQHASWSRWITFLMAWSRKLDTKIIMFLLTCVIFILLVVYNKDEQLNVIIGKVASIILAHYAPDLPGARGGAIHFQEGDSARLDQSVACPSLQTKLIDLSSIGPCVTSDDCVSCCFNNITNNLPLVSHVYLMKLYNDLCTVNTTCVECFDIRAKTI